MSSPSLTPAPAPLKAVLFDSGGVLMQPIDNRWHPRADFEQTVLRHDPHVTAERFAAAIEVGDRFMAAAEATPDLDRYHAAMLGHLEIPASADLLAELVRPVPATAAIDLGYQGRWMDRADASTPDDAVPGITSLADLLALFPAASDAS